MRILETSECGSQTAVTCHADIIRSSAVRAEELGYDSVWVSDHVVVPRANVVNFGETVYDPLVTLGVLAGTTRRVRLGTTVLIVPYRNAVVTAKMVSSLDALSGGRLLLGVGAGWVAAESAMLGVPFAERGAMPTSTCARLQTLWTASPSFAGTSRSRRPRVRAQAVQKPIRRSWVGGHSRAALRRTVEVGGRGIPSNGRSRSCGRVGPSWVDSVGAGARGAAGAHAANEVIVLRPRPGPRRSSRSVGGAGRGARRAGRSDHRAGRGRRRGIS